MKFVVIREEVNPRLRWTPPGALWWRQRFNKEKFPISVSCSISIRTSDDNWKYSVITNLHTMPHMPLSEFLTRSRRVLKTTFMIGGTYYLYVNFFCSKYLLRVVKARHWYDLSVIKDQNRHIKNKYVYRELILNLNLGFTSISASASGTRVGS